MLRFRQTYVVFLYISLSASSQFAGAQDQERTTSLLLRFRESPDVAGKEKILNLIVQQGYGAGPPLLQLTKTADDSDTRWLAIRGLGILRFEEAAPFLIESLK